MKKGQHRHSLEFGIIICVLFLLGAGAYSLVDGVTVAGSIEIGAGLIMLIYFIFVEKNRTKEMAQYMTMLTSHNNTMANDAISRFPLPMVVLSIDGQIMWYNDMMSEMVGNDDLYSIMLPAMMPDLHWTELLKTTDSIAVEVSYGERIYDVKGNIVKSNELTDDNGNYVYSVLLYFIDRTDISNMKKKYIDERTDIAVITIDNYDEVFQKMDDSQYQETLSQINRFIGAWVNEGGGFMKKTERDRYIVAFEHQRLEHYIDTKFGVLDKVRSVGEEIKVPITISVGIGTGGHISENEAGARAAIDMAWGRGGDQAVIKEDGQYRFYGGKTKDYEKSTRVKTRTFTGALRELITKSDKVILMGHANSDFDSLGAAIGLQRAIRLLGKRPYIVNDNSPAVKKLFDEIKLIPEYEGMMISGAEAQEAASENTLLIILDTHRPSMLPCAELLKTVKKIVLIDHHRRSTEFIENCSLIYHEPYASSTCEMTAEILQYIGDNSTITPFEAKALYVGILMDTKNFTMKTGVRTFEAASFLKKYGLNMMDVKRFFNVDKHDYIHRIEIVKNSEMLDGGIALSICYENYSNIRVISSQAADDMLNITGTKAAFVIYPIDGEISISARSLGEINVQVIMEKLGGGGHMTLAGVQLKSNNINEINRLLQSAIRDYIKENTEK